MLVKGTTGVNPVLRKFSIHGFIIFKAILHVEIYQKSNICIWGQRFIWTFNKQGLTLILAISN